MSLRARLGLVPTPPARPALLRIWLFGVLAVWAAMFDVRRAADAVAVSWAPVSVYRLLPGPPSHAALVTVRALLVLAALAAAAGLATRVSQTLATVLGVFLLGLLDADLGRLYHYHALLALLLLVLLPARLGDGLSLDGAIRRHRRRVTGSVPAAPPASLTYAWPVTTAMLVTVAAYVGAAGEKLRTTGPSWVSAASFTPWMYVKLDREPDPSPLGLWIAAHPALVTLTAAAVLAAELSALAVPLFPWVRPFSAAALVGFHLGSEYVLDFHFGLMAAVEWLPLVLPGVAAPPGWRALRRRLRGSPGADGTGQRPRTDRATAAIPRSSALPDGVVR